MASKFTNRKQKEFFQKLFDSGELLFSSGKTVKSSFSADMYGLFQISELKNEDRLDIDDNTHVHVNWENIHSVSIGLSQGEGEATFFNNEGKALFRFYKFDGPFPQEIKDLGEFLSKQFLLHFQGIKGTSYNALLYEVSLS